VIKAERKIIMKIAINNSRKIFAIQEEFSKMFPCLKLEFFAKPSRPGAAPSKNWSGIAVRHCRIAERSAGKGLLTSCFHEYFGLKENFRDIYGLSVEIFRKAENGADDTPVSDKLTLEEANKKD